jgi:hypothetical protein
MLQLALWGPRVARVAALVVICGLSAGVLDAQEPPPETPQVPVADTVPVPLADTLPAPAEPERSPRGAFLRSLVLPGWGQAWVGAPVRGGVYFTMEVGSLWMTYKSRQKLLEARQEQQWLRESGQLPLGEESALVRSREDQVEDWLALAIFLLFFNAVDAFVAAHLADFGEHIGVIPRPDGGVQFQARIPLGGRR